MLHTTDQVIERDYIEGRAQHCFVGLRNSSWSALKESVLPTRPGVAIPSFDMPYCAGASVTDRIAPREPTPPLGTKGMGGGYPREGMISRWIYCNENNDRERFGAVHRDAGDSFGSRS